MLYFTLQPLRSWLNCMPWRPSQKQRKLPGVLRHFPVQTPASHSSTSGKWQGHFKRQKPRRDGRHIRYRGLRELGSHQGTGMFRDQKIPQQFHKHVFSVNKSGSTWEQHFKSSGAFDVDWVVSPCSIYNLKRAWHLILRRYTVDIKSLVSSAKQTGHMSDSWLGGWVCEFTASTKTLNCCGI